MSTLEEIIQSEPAKHDSLTAAINARKETSENYMRWQMAICLRDMIIRAGGNQTPQFETAKEILKYWSQRWNEEMALISVELPDEIEKELAMQFEAMELDIKSRKDDRG